MLLGGGRGLIACFHGLEGGGRGREGGCGDVTFHKDCFAGTMVQVHATSCDDNGKVGQ
jgi:hypothetical protein